MKTKLPSRSRAQWVGLAILCLSAAPLSAGQFGLFSYQVVGNTVEITGYPDSAVGEVEIPDEIDGKPVASIGEGAFYGCTGLTSVTIPSRVTGIGYGAFSGCVTLASISVEQGNPNYASENGVLFDAEMRVLIRCPEGKAGDYTIPGGVTSIGRIAPNLWVGEAFFNCTGLTSVTIPSSVTGIGTFPFSGCVALASILVEQGNPNYVSEDGVLFDAEMRVLIRCPEGKAGDYSIPGGVTSIGPIAPFLGLGEAFFNCTGLTSVTIPSSVTGIGDYSFYYCSGLTSVTIPSSVTSIGGSAFVGCTGLTTTIFLGDAPSMDGTSPFADTAPAFTIYYLSCSTGFTSPTWAGYPAIRIDERACPAASWLVEHGFAYSTNLSQDLNGDGVSLLMAYALNLDPNLDLRGSLPPPVLDGDNLSMSFHATSPGITYRVETSVDLQDWVTDGVTISDLGPDNQRTASVPRNVPQRFLRLMVQQ